MLEGWRERKANTLLASPAGDYDDPATTMSQSLQSWLLSTLNADAASALDMRTELADMPYLTGNRVQIIKASCCVCALVLRVDS